MKRNIKSNNYGVAVGCIVNGFNAPHIVVRKDSEFFIIKPPLEAVSMKRKGVFCAFALLCVVFAFALVGCGSGYTDEDNSGAARRERYGDTDSRNTTV